MSFINDDLFRRLGEAAGEIFFIYDARAGHLRYFSDHAGEWLHHDPAVVKDTPVMLFEAVHPDDRRYLEQQIYAFDKALTAEFRIGESQPEKHIRLKAYRLTEDNDTSLIAGWLADISIEKNNLLYAERINARKNSMLEILSHDLKEPIGMINMMAGAMKKDPAIAENEVLQGYISIIQDLCDRNIHLIRNLIQQEFSEARSIEIRKERADLIWAVGDIMRQYQASAQVVNKEFVFKHAMPQLYLMMDTLKIVQVVNNLVSNAIKFTADGGKIIVEIADTNANVVLCVSDDGIGVPEDLRPYLFDRHTRAQRPGLRGEEGLGMGLSIIRELVVLHGGSVWYEALPTSGSRFCISLPKHLSE